VFMLTLMGNGKNTGVKRTGVGRATKLAWMGLALGDCRTSGLRNVIAPDFESANAIQV
jgi:hypothetical protein